MPFVPMVPPQRPASARAQDLGRRLKAEVEKFEAQYPGTSREDLRAAAALAIGEESVTAPPRRQATAIVVALIASMGVLAALLEMGSTKSAVQPSGASPRWESRSPVWARWPWPGGASAHSPASGPVLANPGFEP